MVILSYPFLSLFYLSLYLSFFSHPCHIISWNTTTFKMILEFCPVAFFIISSPFLSSAVLNRSRLACVAGICRHSNVKGGWSRGTLSASPLSPFPNNIAALVCVLVSCRRYIALQRLTLPIFAVPLFPGTIRSQFVTGVASPCSFWLVFKRFTYFRLQFLVFAMLFCFPG